MRPSASRHRAFAPAGILLLATLGACNDDSPPNPTASLPASTVTTASPSTGSVTLAGLAEVIAGRDPAALEQARSLAVPGSPAERYFAHQAAARRLIGAAAAATVTPNTQNAGALDICEPDGSCVSVGGLDTAPDTGLLRTFQIDGVPIDARVTGAGATATTDGLSLRVLSAARSAGGGLTVVVEASNSTTTAVQWFGFAATYADDTGAVVECAGVWGTVDLVGGATVSFLLAFPEAALPGVISLTGLREDGVDVAATVDVPSPTG